MPNAQSALARSDLPRATLGVLIIVALIALTLWILRPFLGAIVWAALLVVATWPIMLQVERWLAGSRRLAVATMTIGLLLVLVLPLALGVGKIAANASDLVEWSARLRSFTLPLPPPWLATMPVVGPALADAWRTLAAGGIADLAATVAPYTAVAVLWAADALRGAGSLLIQFLLTVAIAAVMYARGERAADAVLQFGRRLAGEHGDRAVRLAARAIRGVALGVIVTAAVQSALAVLGLVVAGVPFAALLGAAAFVLCIAQIGPMPVLAPAVAWLYWQGASGTATALLVWTVGVVLLDNVLRPLLMTKGANLPMLLMFAGVIGGLLSFGLIGIFIGPVVLAVTYTLLGAWVGDRGDAPTADLTEGARP
jgi:predicted PurR-regulated permease PerM